MRRRLFLALVVLAACDYPRLPRLATDDPGAGGGNDISDGAVAAEPDSSTPPSSDACTSFATLLALDTCQLTLGDDLVIQVRSRNKPAVYDTRTHILTVDDASVPVTHTTVTIAGDIVDVISARTVTLAEGTTLRAVGPRPLVIAASEDIVVSDDAIIDVSNDGAGAQTSCVDGAFPGAADTGGAAGGGGGGFGADGGKGGNGDSNGVNGQSIGGAKGRAVAAVPSGLRGGCPGASGGKGDDSGGAGGKAGGALYLVAARRIELGGASGLNAGGGPGLGAVLTSAGSDSDTHGDAGGGGGGSGGMLVLEAPHIVGASATIAANGGGGGGGGDSAVAGSDGSPGTMTTGRASGGGGGGSGVPGGKGGSKANPAGEDVTRVDVNGGGGGGGGVGIIRIKATDKQLGVVSPDPR